MLCSQEFKVKCHHGDSFLHPCSAAWDRLGFCHLTVTTVGGKKAEDKCRKPVTDDCVWSLG